MIYVECFFIQDDLADDDCMILDSGDEVIISMLILDHRLTILPDVLHVWHMHFKNMTEISQSETSGRILEGPLLETFVFISCMDNN